MRKQFLQLCKKLRLKFCFFYTWLLKGGLKACGPGTRIEFPCRLEQPGSITLGKNVMIYPRTWLNPVADWAGQKHTGEIVLGDGAQLGYGVQISAAASIVLEEDVTVSAGAVIVDHIHDHRHLYGSIFDAPISVPQPVRIGKHSFLGVYCLVGPGVQIGEHAVVAANAVVMKNVPSYCIAAGNPARIVRFHDPEAVNTAETEVQVGK